MHNKQEVPVREHTRSAQPSGRSSRRHSLQATIEHHVLVLLAGAIIGSVATFQLMNQQDAKTQAAVQNALQAASTPAPVAQPSK